MKICFLADCNHVNTLNWAEYFSDRLNHEVHIISFNNSKISKQQIQIHFVPTIFSNTKIKYIVTRKKVMKLISEINPDIIIGYRITSYGFLASTLNFKPLVLAAQGQNIVWPANNKIKRILAKYAIAKADLIHSWAEHMTKKLIELGAENEKILTLPKGINTEVFHSNNIEPFNCRKRIKKVICTRALKKEYDHETLFYAISELKNHKDVNLKFQIVGDGDNKDNLMVLAKNLGISEYIIFNGHLSYDQLPKMYRDSDIYVSTVPTDGVSSSMLEAMACGLIPIVVDNTANNQWINDNINGYIFKAGDYKCLSQKILIAAESPCSNTMKTLNKNLIEDKFSIHNNMLLFEEMYFKLVESYQKN